MSNMYEIFMPIKDYEDTYAVRQLNLNKGNIDSCCKGKQKSTKGYQFQYYIEGDVQ